MELVDAMIRRTPLKRSTKRIRSRRRVVKVSQHFENINDEYRLYKDGRMVAFDTPKGQVWYQAQTIAMADRQRWICGFTESGNCLRPGRLMTRYYAGELMATFEHWNKRGAGKRNDSIAPETKNCAVHFVCNGAVGSRRI